MKKRPTWIPVVTGIIQREDKVLLGRRPEGGSLPGVWEFPGGKVERNESPEDALQRELNEELGIDAKIGQLLFSITHFYAKDVGILLLFYKVSYWKGEPKTQQHTELKWVKLNELSNIDFPEANKKVLPRILEYLKNSKD